MSVEGIEIKQYTVSEYLVELMNQHGNKLGDEIAYRIEDKDTGKVIVEANIGQYVECYELIDPYMMMKARITSIEKTTTYYEFKYGPLANNAPLKAKTDKIGYIIQIDTKNEKVTTESTEEKVLIYSIEPEYIEKIANGQKTIEVRKRSLPQWALNKLEQGGIVNAYGYCIKRGSILSNDIGSYTTYHMPPRYKRNTDLNGKVVIKFQVSGTTKYVDCSDCTNTENGYECENEFMYLLSVDPILRKSTCLEADEIEEYGNGADLYTHHLTNIQLIEPMKISDFYKVLSEKEKSLLWKMNLPTWKKISKPPQSFMTAIIYGGTNNG